MLLKTLGTFELLAPGEDGRPVRLMGPQKPLAMLAYVALAPGRRVTRDQLVDLLWRNLEVERGRRTLRQTLFSVRQRLGDVLVSEGEYVVLAAPLAVDCQQFDEARDENRLDEAWRLYTGDFVADFATAGSAPFEQWCDRQRDRLRAAWFSVGEALVQRTLLENPREAAGIAGQLRDAAPERADLWAARLRALLLAGERVEARAEVQQLQQRVAQGALTLAGELRALVRELETPATVASSDEPSVWRRPELVGREGAFAVLLAEWQATVQQPSAAGRARLSSASQGGMLVVRGAPGIGKTMLLEEFAQRARGIGGHVLSARARRVNTDTPYALLAALADRLAALPGAMGVSTATASILVDLSPALSSVFRSATPRSYTATELPRLRTQAMLELLAVVCDERPVLVIIDDLHWADDASRQVLATVGESLADSAMLLVVATRPTRRWVAPDAARYLDLPPLSREQVELLVASVAIAEPPLLRDLASALVDVSGGVPLLVVSALELALERQFLTIDGDRWLCPNPEALRRALGQGGVLEKLLSGVSPMGLRVLTALAVADGALSDDVLAASVLSDGGTPVTDDLVHRGLVVHGLMGLEIAHDELADAALAIVRPDERQEIMRRVGHALLDERTPSLLSLSLAGRLLAEVGDARAAHAFDRWLAQCANPLLWRDPMRAAADFLGAAATPHLLTRLARSVPWAHQFTRGRPQAARTAIAVATVLSLFGVARTTVLVHPAPVAMQLLEPASSGGIVWCACSVPQTIPVRMGGIAVDAKRLPTTRAPRTVRVAFERTRGTGELLGTTTRTVENGRVAFDDLRLSASAEGYFVLHAEGLPPARSQRLVVLRHGEQEQFERLQLAGGQINGQPIDSTRTRITVAPGAPLTGMVQLRSLTASGTASIISGAVALWGDRRTNFLTLAALPPHGAATHRPVLFTDATGNGRILRAPTVPGRYQVVFLFGSETEFQYVASNTNWTMGASVWNDGNDIADLTPPEIDQLRTTGVVPRRMLIRPTGQTVPAYLSRFAVGTVLDVVVER